MKRIVVGGLLGGILMIVWFVVADGILGMKRSVEMKDHPNERVVYEFLSEQVTEPGRYIINPEVLPEQAFPGQDPIFSVHYNELGHDDAGQEMLMGLAVALLASLAGAWLLANASSRVLSGYGSRLFFLAMIGLVLALTGAAARFGISSYPLRDALILGVHDLAAWVVAGLAIAWKVKPNPASGAFHTAGSAA